MPAKRLFILPLLCIMLISCDQPGTSGIGIDEKTSHQLLLLQDFNSLEELERLIEIKYSGIFKSRVNLILQTPNGQLISTLQSGVNQDDLQAASQGSIWDKLEVCLRSPYAVARRNDLYRIMILSRRRRTIFGEGDIAFYDVSQKMVSNIMAMDQAKMDEFDLADKGHFNTINHITAQAFMTSIFSERFAELVAKLHELKNLPELTTGEFSSAQLSDRDFGPVDNYVDMINNEWGQILGVSLKNKYGIQRNTVWTPTLLCAFLNDIQDYYSRNLDIGFKPFRPTDDLVLRFSRKLNVVMQDVSVWRP